jgi:hypothetical protein
MRSGRIVHPLMPAPVFSILLVALLVSPANTLLITFSDRNVFDFVAGDVFPLPLSDLSQAPGEHLVFGGDGRGDGARLQVQVGHEEPAYLTGGIPGSLPPKLASICLGVEASRARIVLLF